MSEKEITGWILLCVSIVSLAIPAISRGIDGGESIDPDMDKAIYIMAAGCIILGVCMILT